MKQIRVYLQYPSKFPDSPYYKYLIQNPPKNIEYFNIAGSAGVTASKKKLLFLNFIKKFARRLLILANLSLPNAHLVKGRDDFDLIHCAHCLSKNLNKPWVVDVESWWQFWLSANPERVKTKKILEILMHPQCKKILAWTEAVEKDLVNLFPEVKDKFEVVYPAVPFKGIGKKNKGDRINLLFSGRYFYEKGGLHALEAIDRLTKKYDNVYGRFISTAPKEILDKYFENKKISFSGLIPQSQLFNEVLPETDILLYPGYSDTFGFLFLEAMSFGIPIITMEGFARSEIIEEGKTGFIINFPYNVSNELYRVCRLMEKEEMVFIEEMVNKASVLIENKNLRNKMSLNCLNLIKNGKFSIEKRNKQLRQIYEGAINESKFNRE